MEIEIEEVVAENIEVAVLVQVIVQAETIALIHTKKHFLIQRAGYFCNKNQHYAQCTYLLVVFFYYCYSKVSLDDDELFCSSYMRVSLSFS